MLMSAEWEKHKVTWLAWPHDAETFPQRIAKVEQVFATIIYHLHHGEDIELLVLNESMQQKVTAILKDYNVNLSKINFHHIDYADVWLRDYGPTFVVDQVRKKSAWIKWIYNAYGEKFPELLKDNDVPYQLQKYINLPILKPNIIMEGGAIDVNGSGCLLTTKECLLNPNRNPNLTQRQIKACLKKHLGVSKIIWLEKGIPNDHTDGHIDELARFVNANTIVYGYKENNNWDILQHVTDQDNNPFNLIKLPVPKFNYDNGEAAPASYANFYIANEVVLVPQFNHTNDALALEIMQPLFPDRKIVGINCEDLIYGGGTIHCITQQQPELAAKV